MGQGEVGGGFFTADEVSYAAVWPTAALPNRKVSTSTRAKTFRQTRSRKIASRFWFTKFPGIIPLDRPR